MTIAEAVDKGVLKDHKLLVNSQDVKAVLEDIGECSACWDGLFAKIEQGDYVSVFGFKGVIPASFKTITKLK